MKPNPQRGNDSETRPQSRDQAILDLDQALANRKQSRIDLEQEHIDHLQELVYLRVVANRAGESRPMLDHNSVSHAERSDVGQQSA